MKVYELLDAPRKWTQGRLIADGDPCARCLFGAVLACYPESYMTQTNAIRAHVGGSIVNWNDAPERTYEDVIALCRELDI